MLKNASPRGPAVPCELKPGIPSKILSQVTSLWPLLLTIQQALEVQQVCVLLLGTQVSHLTSKSRGYTAGRPCRGQTWTPSPWTPSLASNQEEPEEQIILPSSWAGRSQPLTRAFCSLPFLSQAHFK
ncbi:Hypothetical predicted protein [Marmota monax]|uniref:Uncharacterized protein n=1 Tax=Marmota monax TaxID=9995 RepID=A0A5E4BVH9_MARMO|nr:Hypothetical predicted protein [Marmota monax]